MKVTRDNNARLLSDDDCYSAWIDSGLNKPHNPPPLLSYRTPKGRQVVEISAGTRDDVIVYRSVGDSDRYVFTRNHSLGYCGIEIFNIDGERVGDCFCQYEHELLERGLPNGLDHAPYTIVKTLAQYIY